MRQNSVHPCAEVFEPIQTPFERPSIRVPSSTMHTVAVALAPSAVHFGPFEPE